MSLFPFTTGEFTPLFRLLDDYDVHRTGRGSSQTSTIRAFRPKFDVHELKDSYELQGELPGVDQKEVNIEFVDPHTLIITGRVERTSTQGTPPSDIIETGKQPAGRVTSATDQSTSPRKANVENGGSAKPSASAGRGQTESDEEPQYKYWISERSVGEFHRSFSFPSRVDQDAVKASLKDGILSVIVPKAPTPVSKKIRID